MITKSNQTEGLLGSVHAVEKSANIDLNSPPVAIDGVTLVSGRKYALLAQTDQTQNGIHTFDGSVLARPTHDSNIASGANIPVGESSFSVTEGTLYAGKQFYLSDTDGSLDGYENPVAVVDTNTQIYSARGGDVLTSQLELGGGSGTTVEFDHSGDDNPPFNAAGGYDPNVADFGAMGYGFEIVMPGGNLDNIITSASVGDLETKINTALFAGSVTLTWDDSLQTLTMAFSSGAEESSGNPLSGATAATGDIHSVFSLSPPAGTITVATGDISGDQDGSNADFVIDNPTVVLGVLYITENGQVQDEGDDYSYVSGTQTISFTSAPQPGDKVNVGVNFLD